MVDGDGHYNRDDISPAQAVKRTLPRNFGSPNHAIEAIFKGWMAFRRSQAIWRLNPSMPEGDVTPSGTIRARPAERLSKHWPYLTVGVTSPQDPI